MTLSKCSFNSYYLDSLFKLMSDEHPELVIDETMWNNIIEAIFTIPSFIADIKSLQDEGFKNYFNEKRDEWLMNNTNLHTI